jgi:hypothetical protein
MKNLRSLSVVFSLLTIGMSAPPHQDIKGQHRKIFSPTTAGITAGDGIVCEFLFANSASFTGLSDSLNGTLARANSADFTAPDVPGITTGIYYVSNSAHGTTDTATMTISPAQPFTAMSCQAYKNMKVASPLDSGTNNPGNTNTAGTTSTNPSSGNFQTTVNGDLLISYLINTSATVPTAATGTLVDTIPFEGTFPQFFVQTTASASSQMNYTSASDTWAMLWATFQNNGSAISLDGGCHSKTDNGSNSLTTIIVNISC